MKYFNFLIICLLITTWSFGQAASATEPFILKGKLTNLAKEEFAFVFFDGTNEYVEETVKVDSSGSFYLKTYAIKQPKRVWVRLKDQFPFEIYAAPGYDLVLTGDVKDLQSFLQERKISGKGAESNHYLLRRDISRYSRLESLDIFTNTEKELVKYLERERNVSDSLYSTVFRAEVDDKWFKQFAKITQMDNQFALSEGLFLLATVDANFTAQQAVAFLEENNVDKEFWDNLFDPENCNSVNYITTFMTTYADFLFKQAQRRDPNYGTGKMVDFCMLDQIAANFKGPAKEIELFRRMKALIIHNRSFERSTKFQKGLPDYIALLKDPKDQEKLRQLVEDKAIELKTAPK